jgi:hypothetical protein
MLGASKGISLEEIAQHTKLQVTTLKAIEDGNFDALPGAYTTSATFDGSPVKIGADESSVIQLYRKSCAGPDDQSGSLNDPDRIPSGSQYSTGWSTCVRSPAGTAWTCILHQR